MEELNLYKFKTAWAEKTEGDADKFADEHVKRRRVGEKLDGPIPPGWCAAVLLPLASSRVSLELGVPVYCINWEDGCFYIIGCGHKVLLKYTDWMRQRCCGSLYSSTGQYIKLGNSTPGPKTDFVKPCWVWAM